jgi:hypothetical protein
MRNKAKKDPTARQGIQTISVEEYRAMQKSKRSKYGNVKTKRIMPNGSTYTFDSIRESVRYEELRLLLLSGDIKALTLQPSFTLQESFITHEGERIQAIRYVADFRYLKKSGECTEVERPDGSIQLIPEWITVIEDVKSPATRKNKEYLLKKKLMAEKYNIHIKEV